MHFDCEIKGVIGRKRRVELAEEKEKRNDMDTRKRGRNEELRIEGNSLI